MGRSPYVLGRFIERMAALSAPRHRELVRAMVAELDVIADPAERLRFAMGAIAAVVRLAARRGLEATGDLLGRRVGAPEPRAYASTGGLPMPELSTRQLLRRHATPFGATFGLLTALVLTNFAMRQLPSLHARGAPTGTLFEVLLLALPFTMAMTIPMAVFLAVTWVFTRLGREGVLTAAHGERHGIRRLIGPVLGAAAIVATVTLVSNSVVVPRANARLAAVLAGTSVSRNDRTMTVTELREEAQHALAAAGPGAASRAAAYEVEIQKKFALAAACLVMALAGTTLVLRFPRGGMWLVVGASGVVFTCYYAALVAGEWMADELVLSPFAAMWMANALLLVVALLLSRRSASTGGAHVGLGRTPAQP